MWAYYGKPKEALNFETGYGASVIFTRAIKPTSRNRFFGGAAFLLPEQLATLEAGQYSI